MALGSQELCLLKLLNLSLTETDGPNDREGMEANNNKDKIARAYSRLSALRQNAPDRYVDEEHVREYHQALQHLADLGFDVEEFMIPDHWLQHRVTGRRADGTPYWNKDLDATKFLSKLDAVLTYLSIYTTGEEGAARQVVGFAARGK